jgi:hypothetical protein
VSSSPMSALLLPALMSRIGGGSPGGGGSPSSAPGSPAGGVNPEAIGAAVSQEYSQLQNVDPGKILADLQKYKQAISAIFPVAVNRVADAAKGISQAVTGLNSAIKAFEKAQETLKNVHPPLGLQSAQQQPTTGATPFGPQPGGASVGPPI